MPAAKPPDLRRRAVELARAPGATVTTDLEISESCLRRRMTKDDVRRRPSRGPRPETPGILWTCPILTGRHSQVEGMDGGHA